jgi:hypothetical protein
MASAPLICIIIALVLFALAMFSVPAGRFSLVAGGLFFWCLSTVIGGGISNFHLH